MVACAHTVAIIGRSGARSTIRSHLAGITRSMDGIGRCQAHTRHRLAPRYISRYQCDNIIFLDRSSGEHCLDAPLVQEVQKEYRDSIRALSHIGNVPRTTLWHPSNRYGDIDGHL